MKRATKSATCSSLSPGLPAARISTSACRRQENTQRGSGTRTTTQASTRDSTAAGYAAMLAFTAGRPGCTAAAAEASASGAKPRFQPSRHTTCSGPVTLGHCAVGARSPRPPRSDLS